LEYVAESATIQSYIIIGVIMDSQLSLFEDNDEISILKRELAEVKRNSENVRKSLFARHNELAKMYLDLKNQMNASQHNNLLKKEVSHGTLAIR
jgi:hypothetical protein